jgi:uncharacterized membrane protein
MRGLIPVFLVYLDIYVIFTYTDWAWSHCGWVALMLSPIAALINCKQIVCNCAKQENGCLPMVTMWWLLFPLNRILPTLVKDLPLSTQSASGAQVVISEGVLALLVTVITTFWFLHWAVGTIGQICEAYDIWCLQIKPDALKRKKSKKA